MRAPTGTAVQCALAFFRNIVGARIARPLLEFVQNFGFAHLLFFLLFLKTLKAIRAHFHALIIFHLALFGKQSLINVIFGDTTAGAPSRLGEGAPDLFYSAALIFSIISAYCASVSFVWPGFMANTPPHSKPSLYFGTRWTCRWQPVSPYAP